MSTGLLSQLDTYYSWIDEAQDPIHPDEVAALIDTSVRELEVPVPAKPRRGWLVAVAVAAAVLVLAGGATLLSRGIGSDLPVTTTPQIDSLSSLTWSRVPHDESVFGGQGGQSMFDVTVGGPGLVAVGESGTPGDFDAAVWTSPDGITWSRVPHNETVFGKGSMGSVTVGGPGLVAVGFDGDPQTRIHNAVVWTSPDGITWSRVSRDNEIFASEEPLGPEGMTDVIAVGPGLVAVGLVGDPQTELNDAAVWTSPDGVAWSRVPHNEPVFGGQPQVAMLRVIVGGPGLVAVGESGSERDFDAAVWIGWVED